MNRRDLIKSGSLGLIASSFQPKIIKPKSNFTLCLNTSTIMRQNIGLVKELEMAAAAGFEGIEVWIRTLESFKMAGGNFSDVKKRASDLGIKIVNAIGFAAWMSDDPNVRGTALEQTKREMDMLQQIGCNKIAAPPFGVTTQKVKLELSAARYRDLCDIGSSMGVQPQLEIWGFSQNIHLVGQSLFIAAESGVPNTAILADVYHLHKGGSATTALSLIPSQQLEIFHMNDYPAEPKPETLTDAHRVMPGDGAAPINEIIKTLASKNKSMCLSLELFSEKYWAMPVKEVLAEGIDKMKRSVSLI